MRSQHYTAVGSLVLCRFTGERGFGMLLNDAFAQMVNGVTGFGMTTQDLERVGGRIINLERAFNVREGVRRKDDLLPYRVMHEPIPFGPSKGRCPPTSWIACSMSSTPYATGPAMACRLGAPRGSDAAGRGRDDGVEWTEIARDIDNAGYHWSPCLSRSLHQEGLSIFSATPAPPSYR